MNQPPGQIRSEPWDKNADKLGRHVFARLTATVLVLHRNHHSTHYHPTNIHHAINVLVHVRDRLFLCYKPLTIQP